MAPVNGPIASDSVPGVVNPGAPVLSNDQQIADNAAAQTPTPSITPTQTQTPSYTLTQTPSYTPTQTPSYTPTTTQSRGTVQVPAVPGVVPGAGQVPGSSQVTPAANSGGVFDGLLGILKSLGGSVPGINTNGLSDSLSTMNSSATMVLNNQGTLNNIIDDETRELNLRLQNMNDSATAAQRNLILNESARLRTQDYNTILFYFIGLIIFLNALTVLNRWYHFLSREVYDLIIIFTVFFVFVRSFWKYTDIASRDMINYNELSLPRPSNVSLTQDQIISQNNFNQRQLANKGMLFNLPQANCPVLAPSPMVTPTITNGFTLLSEVDYNDVVPNSFNEFDNYSKI